MHEDVCMFKEGKMVSYKSSVTVLREKNRNKSKYPMKTLVKGRYEEAPIGTIFDGTVSATFQKEGCPEVRGV